MRLLTMTQVATILQVPPSRVYELARQRLIPVVRLGRQVRVDEDELRRWIKAGGQSLGRTGGQKG